MFSFDELGRHASDDITCSASQGLRQRIAVHTPLAWREMHRPVVLLHDTHKVSAGRRSAIAWAMRSTCWAWANVSTTRRACANPAASRVWADSHRHGTPARRGTLGLFLCSSASSSRCATPAWRRISLTVRQARPRADDDVVLKSRCLRVISTFFSLGWLNDAAGAAQEPGKYIVMADQ